MPSQNLRIMPSRVIGLQACLEDWADHFHLQELYILLWHVSSLVKRAIVSISNCVLRCTLAAL